MNCRKMVIREILFYEFQFGHSAKEAFENICKTMAMMLLSSKMLIFGLVNLKMGFFNLEDESRTGRPRSFDAAVINDATESNPSTSVRR